MLDGAERIGGRHGLEELPKVYNTAAGVVAEARRGLPGAEAVLRARGTTTMAAAAELDEC